MSRDFVEDAVDSLDKDEDVRYVLLVGKAGFRGTRVDSNLLSAEQCDVMIDALQEHKKIFN